MNPQVSSIVDVILDRSPEELIGGVLLALVLALGLSGLFHLIRRKVSDTSTLIICLALSSNLVAMTVAGAYIRYKVMEGKPSRRGMMSAGSRLPPPGMGESRSMFMASRILEAADRNGDHRLSADEAALLAAQFVKESGGGGDEPISEEKLRAAIRARLGPHSGMGMGIDGPSLPPEQPLVNEPTGVFGKAGKRRHLDAERSTPSGPPS
ncbi:hypothetical protein V5E97_29010 [Singulisphaera sp. Ch08]|uniref:EF-hand domain-containing protein n=1 Tax=Singulisphaera sp. Ch08 TaxID=3120278 RepID=A0AAU7CBL3_9BACT